MAFNGIDLQGPNAAPAVSHIVTLNSGGRTITVREIKARNMQHRYTGSGSFAVSVNDKIAVVVPYATPRYRNGAREFALSEFDRLSRGRGVVRSIKS